MDDFDLNFDLSFDFDKEKQIDQVEKRESVGFSHRLGKRKFIRKASSEDALEKILPYKFENAEVWHIISQGDIDSFSYVKHLMRTGEYEELLLSTWCMAGEDIFEIENWLERGILKKADLYVGEIFKNSYPEVYELATQLHDKYGIRVCTFRNHSKVSILTGKKICAVIESSANVNTNPRCEQTCITFDKDLAKFYKDFYNGIVNFNKDLD